MMTNRKLTPAVMDAFRARLLEEERAPGTVEKYLRDAGAFALWLEDRPVTREQTAAWKEWLLARGYAPVTVNSMLAAVHRLFACLGWSDCRVRFLRLQRRLFREERRELTREEYQRLVDAARRQGKRRLTLLLEAICATGIRVSEVRYLTVEAARRGRADVRLKGKLRTILLPDRLCRKLLRYAKEQKIRSGEIFLTRRGGRLSRCQIWAEMKGLCGAAGVAPSKVFPHNLRHLFARTFYQVCRDVVRLADVLGHSQVETTRIYLLSTGAEHRAVLERVCMIS
ncbi:MAG: tyrosine-type recombinase/integrase [Lawsonibacter sp.]|jgi:integrase/recombinase XerD